MTNPFTLELALGTALINRRAELQAVRTALLHRKKLFVIGPRRFGKTSILLTAAAQLRREKVVILDFNIEGYTSLDLLVRGIVSGAAGLAGNLTQATKSIRRFFSSLQPSLSAGIDGTVSASLGIKPPEQDEQSPLLMEALNSLNAMAGQSGQTVGLIFDEFQHLLKLGGAGIEGQLRAAVQTHQHLGYVFAGSQTTLIADMVSNPARPFYRLGENLFIGAIPRPELLAFLTEKFAALDCHEEDNAFTALLTAAEDVPYNAQALARACWDEVSQSQLRQLTPALVQATVQRLVRSNAPIFVTFWGGLTALQQKALAAVAAAQGQHLTSRAVLKRFDLSAGAMQKSLQALENATLIRREFTATSVSYRFEDPFLKLWIAGFTVTS